MAYPNPLTVRTVKAYLKDAAADAGMIGATAVVQGVMGSAWGWLLNRSNNREYLNFIGELAGRTVSPNVEKIANQVYQNSHVVFRDGQYKVQIPAAFQDGRLLNDDGSDRQNNHTYDTINYGSDMRGKFRHNYTYIKNNPTQKITDNTKKNNNNNNQKQLTVKPHNKNSSNKNKQNKQQKNMSESLLIDTIDEMCARPCDFSILTAIKEKLAMLFGGKSRSESAKALLQGCYEYLDENGYDAYPLMVQLVTAESKEFSEGLTTNTLNPTQTEITISDLQLFKKCAELYSLTSPEQKEILKGYLESECGVTPANEYLYDLAKWSETGVPPTKRRLKVFKTLTVIASCLAALRALCILTRPPAQDDVTRK